MLRLPQRCYLICSLLFLTLSYHPVGVHMMCMENPFIDGSANLVSSFILWIDLVRILSFLLISLKQCLCQFSLVWSNRATIRWNKCKVFTALEALSLPFSLCTLENAESPSRIVLILKYSEWPIGSIWKTILPLNTFLYIMSSLRLYPIPKIILKSFLRRRLLMASQ